MNNREKTPAAVDGPEEQPSSVVTNAQQRRPFTTPTVEKVGELKDLTQLQFSGGG